MARIAEVARAAAVPLCFVAIPSAVDACLAYEAGQVDAARFPSYRRERLTAIVAGLAAELGVPVVDLFPAFWAGGRDALYFRPPDGHWNDRAQALAAGVVAARVRELGVVRGAR
jgi:hypothetical protein